MAPLLKASKPQPSLNLDHTTRFTAKLEVSKFCCFACVHVTVIGLFAASHAFEGARISFSRPVGMHMQLQHQLHLGKENSYHLSPTYVGTLRQVSPQEVDDDTLS